LLLVRPFVWFVVAFGCGVVLHTSAEKEALGNRRVTQEAGIIRAAHTWYAIFSKQKALEMLLLVRPFVGVVFGFWCCAYISRERCAWGSSRGRD